MTDVRIVNSTAPVDSLVMASIDPDTIAGSGTTFDPLRASSALDGFRFIAHMVNIDDPFLGTYVSGVNFPGDETFVAPGDARPIGGGGKQTVGFVIAKPDPPSEILIQCGGIVTLDEDSWSFITLGEGLIAGRAYFLTDGEVSGIGGAISSTPPAEPEAFIVLAGVALNSTQLLTTSVPGVLFRNPP